MKITTYSQQAVLPLMPLLNSWCTEQLKSYPYLYSPEPDRLVSPTDLIHVNEPQALVAVATENDQTVSVAAGLPLSSYYLTAYYLDASLIEKFQQKNLDPKNFWYMTYFLVAPQQRDNKELILAIYEKFIAQLKSLGKKYITYIDVIRPNNHPQKPVSYRSPEPWDEIIKGFTKSGVVISATWPTIQVDGNVQDEAHQLEFFIK